MKYGTHVTIKSTGESGEVIGNNGNIIFVIIPDLSGTYGKMVRFDEVETL